MRTTHSEQKGFTINLLSGRQHCFQPPGEGSDLNGSSPFAFPKTEHCLSENDNTKTSRL